MTLFKLSLKNIKKSYKDYAIYFFTLILGVSIFYVFNTIDSQTAMLKLSSSAHEIVKLMIELLSGVSVFISVLLGFLIIYASRYLMKRRKKEFGIYLTLGMSKRKISTLLFFETLFIGLISLVVGLGIGIILSQAMSIIVANMFEADMDKFKFVFSLDACIKTFIYFGIMYLIVMIFNTISVGKTKLIDLLQAKRKSEQIKLKNPILNIIIFIVSVCLLGYAYYSVTRGFEDIKEARDLVKMIVIGCITTFTIILSMSSFILKIASTFKKRYYKGLNSFTLRQISSNVNTTVFGMSMVTLMLFITICALSTSISIKQSMNNKFDEFAPRDAQVEVSSSNLKTIDEYYKDINIDLNDIFKEKIYYNIYEIENFTAKEFLGSKYDEVKSKYPFMVYVPESIMKISDYNKIAKFYGKKTYSLKDDEYMVISNYEMMTNVRNVALKNSNKINIYNHKLKPKYTKCKDGFVQMSGGNSNLGVILVSDNIVDESTIKYAGVVGDYKTKEKDEKQKLEDKLLKISDIEGVTTASSTRIEIATASNGLSAIVTFIALYLGIIFLISSAAILALKELGDASDNKERFNIIRKLGADEKDINKALFKQIAVFFMIPLIFAIIHSIFGIMFATKLFSVFIMEDLTKPIVMTALFIVLIYGGYFLLTYFTSKNIIKDNR